MVLPSSSVFPDLTLGCDSDMRCEEDEKISVLWNMVTVSVEANFSNEGQASQATHVKATTPKVGEASIQTVRMMVELINTNAACEKCVGCVAAEGEHGIVYQSEGVRGSLGSREVLRKGLHAFSFDERMERQLACVAGGGLRNCQLHCY